jgi:NTE family protein
MTDLKHFPADAAGGTLDYIVGRYVFRRIAGLVTGLLVLACAGCAAPFQRVTTPRVAVPEADHPPRIVREATRPTVGVAFGGGSARGIAHVGVIRWLEEHRIPIDVAAGTSMGGLVGGAYATGMEPDELQAFISTLDWDQLFGGSTFAHKNIRRKADARDYPSRLEFGLKGGIVPPTGINSGEYVDLLLGRIAAPYFDMEDFDDLPTPFRTVAVDLLSAQPVVIRSGSLADAMRATMSLPLIFPPVELNGQVLIDGGTMDNVPADVVKAMGADHVIAVNVGDLTDREGVSYTMLGVAGNTLDAMMRASTRRALTAADVVITVPLEKYGSLDWRRAPELIDEGYRAAEAMRDRLLPFAVSEADFEAWRRTRQARRLKDLPSPTFIDAEGFAKSDTRRLNALMARHIGVPLDMKALEADLAIVSGLDRYETVTWRMVRDGARGYGLRVRGRAKTYAPPFMMLGLNLENTTSSDFRITATARYLAFDTVGSGSEWRLDGTVGSDPTLGTELYRPIGRTPLFVAPYAGVVTRTFNVIDNEAVIARYRQRVSRVGLNVGVNLGAQSDVRVGTYVGRTTASITVGNPGFPELQGKETGGEIVWRLDTQDSPVVPSRGVLSNVRLSRIFNGPDVAVNGATFDFASSVTQLTGVANQFWSLDPRNRVFLYGGFGTSFGDVPLPTDQFALGMPFRLGAYNAGEIIGPNYYIGTGGYLRQVGRLPDFMGGSIFAGGWLENGDAFDEWSLAKWRTNGGVGVVMDTLVGPVIIAGSWGFDGRWRTYFAVGRVFR